MGHVELAQRLNVFVESNDVMGNGDDGTSLSLGRVQVMIAAAARQLVAGSKWITKETFDIRIGELRKEYMYSSRQMQAQLEELGALFMKSIPPNSNFVGS